MVTVATVLTHKPRALHALPPQASVREALEVMREHKVRAVVVTTQGALAGIIAERDCALRVLLAGLDPARTSIESVMTRDVVTVRPDDTLDRCMVEMTRRSIRHLPVCDDERVLAVVSVGDVVKAIMRQQEEHISYLETYIKGHAGRY